jgi:hypothetical protein
MHDKLVLVTLNIKKLCRLQIALVIKRFWIQFIAKNLGQLALNQYLIYEHNIEL